MAVKASKMAVVFGGCGRECLSGPGNTGNDTPQTAVKDFLNINLDNLCNV